MRAARLKELEEMAADLLAIARKLLPGQDRHNALQEIARFRARIIGLQICGRPIESRRRNHRDHDLCIVDLDA
jgi:hypothetical protein